MLVLALVVAILLIDVASNNDDDNILYSNAASGFAAPPYSFLIVVAVVVATAVVGIGKPHTPRIDKPTQFEGGRIIKTQKPWIDNTTLFHLAINSNNGRLCCKLTKVTILQDLPPAKTRIGVPYPL